MKKWKAIFLTALLLVIAGACICEAEESAGVVAKITTKKGALNLRAKPSSTSAVKDEIPNGSCLLVLEEGAEWCLCQWKGKTGYCGTEFLTILRDADAEMLNYRVLRRGYKDHKRQSMKLPALSDEKVQFGTAEKSYFLPPMYWRDTSESWSGIIFWLD